MRKNAKLTNTAERKAFVAKVKGKEPAITPLNYNYDLASFFNFHNINTDLTILSRWAKKYSETTKNKNYIAAVKKAQDYELRKVGMLARARAVSYLEEHHINRLQQILDDLVIKYGVAGETASDKNAGDNTTTSISVQDRIKIMAEAYGGEIDYALDQFLINNDPFSMKGFLASNNISAAVSKKIRELYLPLHKEVSMVVAGKDEDLNEGYSVFGKVKLKKYLALLTDIIAECEQQKTNRKPRKRKEKSPGLLTSKMKYNREQEIDGQKIVSKPATSVVGANMVFLYDTLKRKLTLYHALNNETLTVKGTTILNFDVTKSLIKNVRKPIELLSNSMTSKNLSLYFKNIKSVPKKATGRTNDNQLIIGVF